MIELKGISVSPGIAKGKVFLFTEEKLTIPKYVVKIEEIEKEIKRFLEAIEKAIAEIKTIQEKNSHELGDAERSLLDSHILMLNDPEFKSQIGKKVEEKKYNVEWILLQEIEELVTKMNESTDEYLKARSLDFHDVSRRLIRQLLLQERMSLADLKEDIILVAHNLLPSDAISMNKKHVKGIALDLGSKTSHTAIIARSFNIPTVLGLSDISQKVKNGDIIIVDGNNGLVIIQPTKEITERYNENIARWHQHEKKLHDLKKLPAITKDNKKIILSANIEVAEEVEIALKQGADAIGLFRSEFLFMRPHTIPSEEEQFRAYKYVLEKMKDSPVTIRTLDLGGEKTIPGLEMEEEENPILGWRAVRFCLAKPNIFKAQLRALLRASVYGNLRIMFPMISGIEELLRTLDVVDEVKYELRREKYEFKSNIPIGAMIEVPAAALTSDVLARKVDFFSIGTNDLIQYTIAVDRNNEKIAYLYQPFHPGVLRLIKMIIDNAHQAGIKVSMCGEMAGDPIATIVLLGLELDEYSMSPYSLPEIKNIIRSVTFQEAKELTQTILKMNFSYQIDEYVKSWLETRLALFAY